MDELKAVRRQYNELVRAYGKVNEYLSRHDDPATVAQLFQIQIQMHQAFVAMHLLYNLTGSTRVAVPTLPQIRAAAWDEGFTAYNQEHTKQLRDPSYPIDRNNPYREPGHQS